jgi:hypothetical protein
MKKTTFILPILILALLQSCASAYQPVYPKNIKHTMHETVGDIALSYKYDAIATNGNRKYANRTKNQGFQVVAYTITNNSSDSLVIGKDLVFMAQNEKILVSDALYTAKPVKQYAGGYLPYLAASYFFLYTGVVKNSQTGAVTSYDKKIPIGLIISLPITIGNMFVASFNNTAFYDNIRLNDMNGRMLLPKSNISGLLVFENETQVPLTISRIPKN